jgi:lipopolysaccharide/colanic/teichoic acid biosynthesis glycosyltransferase
MKMAATTGFGRVTEPSSRGHPELAALIENRDPAVLQHLEGCAYCRSELALYRSYERCDDFGDPEDVAWVVAHLSTQPRTSGATACALRYLYPVERIAAGLLLILLSPALLLIGMAIAILSRRSPVIVHTRAGQHGEQFGMLKFRTMWGHTPGLEFQDLEDRKAATDPRVTSTFAALCRRFSIDELPQLVHVASGRMSLVGPRPLTAVELRRHYSMQTAEVLSVKPGLTGLWQSGGRSRLSYRQRKRLDLFFVRHASPGIYFRILFRTIPRVLAGKDAW